MFEQKRRSKKSWVFVLIILAVYLISNGFGYLLAQDQLESALEPTRLPLGNPLAFSRTFRIVLKSFSVFVPLEVAGYRLEGAFPNELTLRYGNRVTGSTLDVTISEDKYFYENRRSIRFPESFFLRKGMTGALAHELFARGPESNGISINPYMALREGFIARLRGALGVMAQPAKLNRISVVGDNKSGQVWRVYQRENGFTKIVEGAVFEPENLAILSMSFTGPTPDLGGVIKAFSQAISFGSGDVAQNAALADQCLSELPYDIEPAWEAGCRQAHLVAMFISEGNTLPVAARLYAEYLTLQNREWIQILYDELHFEMYVTEGWDELIGQMNKDNPWLQKTGESPSS